MSEFEFTIILKKGSELTDAGADALFAAGCDDASPGMSGGVFFIDFDRESESLEKAISSALTQIRQAGFDPDHVEIAAETPALAG